MTLVYTVKVKSFDDLERKQGKMWNELGERAASHPTLSVLRMGLRPQMPMMSTAWACEITDSPGWSRWPFPVAYRTGGKWRVSCLWRKGDGGMVIRRGRAVDAIAWLLDGGPELNSLNTWPANRGTWSDK